MCITTGLLNSSGSTDSSSSGVLSSAAGVLAEQSPGDDTYYEPR